MITHEPGASSPNFVAEILLALDELQEQVDQAGGLPYYAKAQMDVLRRSSATLGSPLAVCIPDDV